MSPVSDSAGIIPAQNTVATDEPKPSSTDKKISELVLSFLSDISPIFQPIGLALMGVALYVCFPAGSPIATLVLTIIGFWLVVVGQIQEDYHRWDY